MPSIEDYRKFKAVADYRGINKAAAALHASSGAISTALNKMERELQLHLMDRETWLPTADGQRWYQIAEHTIDMLDGMTARAQAERGFRFRLAASAYVMEHYIAYVLKAIRQYGGDVPYHLMRCHYPDIPGLLGKARADLVVGPLTPGLSADLDWAPLMLLTPCLLLPDMPAYARIRSFAQLSRSGLITHPLLVPPDGFLATSFDHYLRLKQVTWENRNHCDEVAWIPRLVAAGEGIGVAYDLPSMLRWPGIRPLRLPGIPGNEFGLIWLRALSDSSAPFRRGLKETAEKNFCIGKKGQVTAEPAQTKASSQRSAAK